jgi:hypothetical protein
VEIGGIVSTKSGKYYTELFFDGNPFFDRGFNGEILEFQTAPRIFTGLHEVSSSRHEFSDVPNVENPAAYLATTGQDPFSDRISDITPFSKWQISLPETQSNEDIKFDDHQRGVTVRIIFHIYAQLKETNHSPHFGLDSLVQLKRGYSWATTKTSKIETKSLQFFQSDESQELDVENAKNVTDNDVLKMMTGKSVCSGWDVVFSMTAKEVNNQLKKQYEDRHGNPTFARETGKQVKEVETSEGEKIKTEFNFTFDAPRLEFLLNNSNSAQVFLPIISGDYEYSTFAKGSWILVTKANLKKTDRTYIQGDVPLVMLPSSVSSQHNVAVKLNGGAFSAQHFDAAVANPMLSAVLTEYFTNLKEGYEVYNLGTLDFQTEISVLKPLKPTAFQFNVYHTKSNRDLLQLFIATTGSGLQAATTFSLLEPIPSDCECSLIVNSKIFFQNILPASLGCGGIGLVLTPIPPSDDGNKDKTWSSKATAGSISAPYPETIVPTPQPIPPPSLSEEYIKVKNDTAVVDLKDMQFQHGDGTSGYGIKMSYDNLNKSFDFKHGTRARTLLSSGPSDWSPIAYTDHSLKVKLNISSNLQLSVSDNGKNQLVEIKASPSNVILDGDLEPPAGACKCNDREMQKQFLENLNKSVPDKLAELFNQKFESVSFFALKNLLFPAQNMIDMKKAYVPGDMVVFGKFTS